MARKRMKGKAYKLVLALDGLPRGAMTAARDNAEALALAAHGPHQAPSLDYLEEAHMDMMLGQPTLKPADVGCPTVEKRAGARAHPEAPLLSLNIGNAPYRLREGTWAEQRDVFAKRAIAKLAEYMPNVPGLISDYRIIDPTQFESQFGLVEANITHGDTLPFHIVLDAADARPARLPYADRAVSISAATAPGPATTSPASPATMPRQAVLRDLREARARCKRRVH